MAVLTTQSLLETVETGLTDVIQYGQAVTIGDKTYTRANINSLIALRDKLKAQYDAENRSSRNYVRFKSPL